MLLDRAVLDRLYQYSFSLTNDEDSAYDLLQRGVERYLKASRGTTIDAPVPYIRRCIRNIFIDEYRRSKRFEQVEFEEDEREVMELAGVGSLEGELVAAVDVGKMWTRLRANEREILYLWAVEGMSTSEIAQQSGSPRGTILSRIHRLKKKLRDWYSGDRTKEATS